MKPFPSCLQGILFDLDGTLLDSAPDLYAALKQHCIEEGVVPPPYALVRSMVSRGARDILSVGFPGDDVTALGLRIPRYLSLYEQYIGKHTRPFDGVEKLLAHIEARGLSWGIVTNKSAYLTNQLIQAIGWSKRAAAVVAGDTLSVKKPDPAPVLLACQQAGMTPGNSLFVGDDHRDVLAGRGAGLYTIAAAWGYLGGGDPYAWGADRVLESPEALTVSL